MKAKAGTQEERKEAVNEPAAKRKKSIPRKTTRKRQKLEVETEKEELKTFLDIVPREEAPIDIESLSTKFLLTLTNGCDKFIQHDENDEIWRDQHEYKLLSWRLCDFCGIHILLMENGLAIHMLTEKKYPLSQEMLSRCE
ncbi:hypothetical protein Tco_1549200 [Tanacetum coccineum]